MTTYFLVVLIQEADLSVSSKETCKMLRGSVSYPNHCKPGIRSYYRVAFTNAADVKKSANKYVVKAGVFGSSWKDGEVVAVKFHHKEKSSIAACRTEIEKTEILKRLLASLSFANRIAVTSPKKLKMKRLSDWHKKRIGRDMEEEMVIVEEHIGKSFQTFVDDGFLRTNLYELGELVHLSYKKSGGQYVVAGLQGVTNGSKTVLSSPTIHSRLQMFGISDEGVSGITKTFSNHTCTHRCRNWPRPSRSDDSMESLETATGINSLGNETTVQCSLSIGPLFEESPPPYSNTLDLPPLYSDIPSSDPPHPYSDNTPIDDPPPPYSDTLTTTT